MFTLFFYNKNIGQTLYLEIDGNNPSEDSIINNSNYKTKHTNFNGIQKEIDSIFKSFQRKGYINASRKKTQKRNDSTFFTAFTLKKKIKSIKIFFKPNQIPEELLKKISEEYTDTFFIIPFYKTEQTLKFLNRELSDQGKPFNSLQLLNIKKENKEKISATIKSNTTQIRTIDSIVIKGYEKFPKSYIKNFVRIKKGQIFNKSEIDKKIERLNNLRFANSLRNPEVLFTKDSTILYFYLEKKDSNLFDGFLGFSTNEETSDLELNGYINLQLVNNLNFGESLAITYKSDGNEQQRFNANLKLPYLFNTAFGTELELDLFRKDSTFTTNAQSAKLTYQLNSQISLKAGYQGNSSNYLLDTPPVAGTVTEDYNATFFLAGVNFQELNGYQQLIPIKAEANLESLIGKRQRENSESDQLGIELNAFYNFHLNNRNIIFLGNSTAYLQSDDYLTNELYRFGGIQTMRGFEENSLFASFYSAFQTEYRYLLSSNLYIHTIADFAKLENQVIDNSSNSLFGIGFGLALKTQAGILKLNFANGKTRAQNFEFKNTKIHLSLTAIF